MIYLSLTSALFMLRYVLMMQSALRKSVYFLVFISLFLFSAFRFQVGCDWSGYYNQYLIAANIDWSIIAAGRDPTWWAILDWIQVIGLPYLVISVVSSGVFS